MSATSFEILDVTGVTSGFFDSRIVEGVADRLYNAEQMSSIFDGIIKDGVYHDIGECFMVRAQGDGFKIKIGPGRGWFDHTWIYNDGQSVLQLKDAEIGLTRIDAVVIESNFTEDVRSTHFTIVTGTPDVPEAAKKPELRHDDKVNQHPLAYITVPGDSVIVEDRYIEFVVGGNETPYVTGILDTTSKEEWYAQWRDEINVFTTDARDKIDLFTVQQRAFFDAWFANLQYVLSGDAAGKLQNEIDNLAISIDSLSVYKNKTTLFLNDGSIKEINQDSTYKMTVFNEDGSITETEYDYDGSPKISKTTRFNADGSITEVISKTVVDPTE